jgi:multidrug efflux pump subunit AcrA (membrane-fusion protein)
VAPAWHSFRQAWRRGAFHDCSKRRLVRAGLIAAAALALLVWLAARPGRIEAPAVVEYAPPTTLRAGAAGFVRELRVQSGDYVEAGQPILVLENKELAAELADLRLAASQSAAKAREHSANHELAKYQMETADSAAIEKRIRELTRQINTLTIRSPIAGRIVAREIASLPGQYLQQGAEIGVVGNEAVKELIVAVAQDDLESFQALGVGAIDIRIAGAPGRFQAALERIEPKARLEPPHVALSSRAGGPLPIKMKLAPRSNSNGETAERDELLRPCFTASVKLSADQASTLHAGQRATVSFTSSVETTGGRLARRCQQWLQDRLSKFKPPSSA